MERIVRNEKHRKFINTLPCCTCFNNPPSECSHIRRDTFCGTGIKPSDEYCIPQCHDCHKKVDFIITRKNIDEFKLLAKRLYNNTGKWKECITLILGFRRK